MAMTDYYVRMNANGTDAVGKGTSHALAYQTVQYALNDIGTTHGRNTTDGDVLHICSETPTSSYEVLSAALSMVTYGNPGSTASFMFSGYTAVKFDGGVGEINCGGSNGIWASGDAYINFNSLNIHNAGANTVLPLGESGSAINCEVSNGSGVGILLGKNSKVINCYVHNVGTYGMSVASAGGIVRDNYIRSRNADTNTMTKGIEVTGDPSYILDNIISVDYGTDGIHMNNSVSGECRGNTVIASSDNTNDVGTGIDCEYRNAMGIVTDNLVAGFVATGGVGIKYSTGNYPSFIQGNNAVYDCATLIDAGGHFEHISWDDITLTGDPIDRNGSDTYANRYTYHKPSSEVQGLRYPTGALRDMGAVQHTDPAGGAASGARNPLGGPIG